MPPAKRNRSIKGFKAYLEKSLSGMPKRKARLEMNVLAAKKNALDAFIERSAELVKLKEGAKLKPGPRPLENFNIPRILELEGELKELEGKVPKEELKAYREDRQRILNHILITAPLYQALKHYPQFRSKLPLLKDFMRRMVVVWAQKSREDVKVQYYSEIRDITSSQFANELFKAFEYASQMINRG